MSDALPPFLRDLLPAGLQPAELHGAGSASALAALDAALAGAAVLGVELDTRYRVLAATFELDAEVDPWGPRDDRRIQLLCFPVGTVLASLRRREPDGTAALLTFEESQLVDVVAALDGPVVSGAVLGQPEPRPGEWGPSFSLEGRSSAPDGTRHRLRLELARDAFHLGVFARFDEVLVRSAAGEELVLPG